MNGSLTSIATAFSLATHAENMKEFLPGPGEKSLWDVRNGSMSPNCTHHLPATPPPSTTDYTNSTVHVLSIYPLVLSHKKMGVGLNYSSCHYVATRYIGSYVHACGKSHIMDVSLNGNFNIKLIFIASNNGIIFCKSHCTLFPCPINVSISVIRGSSHCYCETCSSNTGSVVS